MRLAATFKISCRAQDRWYPTSLLAMIFVFAAAFSACSGQEPLKELPGIELTEIHKGWLSLFDGATLFGWHAMSEANWKVLEKQIQVSAGKQGLLRTSAQFDEFDLRLEFKADPKTNSGIFLKTSPNPTDPTVDCIELNIASREVSPFPTGSLVGRIAATQDFKVADWTRLRVVSSGHRIQVWINDVQTCDYEEPEGRRLGRGFIGLQYNSGAVAFRNLRIRPLNLNEVELDRELSAWNTAESRASQFSVSETKELRIKGGPGQLESRDEFGDFVLSLQSRTEAAGLNSGVFFRCLSGDYMNGYESQIQNQFRDGDRGQPVDCGTGGIFRRANARFVNANDQEWFSKTIIACGPNISVWVNGYQVTDWTDRREPHPNPRNGKRLDPGTIILQGHDPGTDISFKNIQVRELQKRSR